jgi:hypothetical protein
MKHETKQKIVAELRNRGIEFTACKLCGKDGYDFPGVFEMREYHGARSLPGAAMAPFAVVSCKHCGNSFFINLIYADIVNAKTGKYWFQHEGIYYEAELDD